MQVKVKTLLNRTQPIPGFCYADVRLVDSWGAPELRVDIEAHAQRPGRCSICERPAPTYDHLERRGWRHVAPWHIPTTFFYIPRRVNCSEHGVRVEAMPWNEGKRSWTRAMMIYSSHIPHIAALICACHNILLSGYFRRLELPNAPAVSRLQVAKSLKMRR